MKDVKDAVQDIKTEIKKAFNDKNPDYNKAAPVPDRLRKNKKIAILTEEDVEDIEFFYPYYRFHEEGYDVDVITLKGGPFEGKRKMGLGDSKSIEKVNPEEYELLYLPGGDAPAKLRKDDKALNFVRYFAGTGKPIAAICHGAQILASAGLITGKTVAAWPEIKDEIEKAGAKFADEALKIDGQFITARMPSDLHRHLNGVFNVLNHKG